MNWIDPWGNRYYQLPERIRLADFTTRTAHEATAEAAINGGWMQVEEEPLIEEPLIEQPFVENTLVEMQPE